MRNIIDELVIQLFLFMLLGEHRSDAAGPSQIVPISTWPGAFF